MASKCKYWNVEHEDCALSYAEIEAKVIDDFADKIITMMPGHKQDVLSIAEQMKAGAE